MLDRLLGARVWRSTDTASSLSSRCLSSRFSFSSCHSLTCACHRSLLLTRLLVLWGLGALRETRSQACRVLGPCRVVPCRLCWRFHDSPPGTAPAENPLDAYRDVNALLRRALTELQTGPKSQQTSDKTPTLQASKPAGLTVDTLRERLGKWLPDVEVTAGFDGFTVRPRRYLGQTWENVNAEIRALGGKWQRGQNPRDGCWRIPK